MNETARDRLACRNCGFSFEGRYCNACGQRRVEERLTLRGLLSDLISRFLNLEKGLLATVWGMLSRPGRVIRRYIDGSRRRYVNPITYLILGAGLALLSFDLFRVDDLLPIYEAQARQGATVLPFSPEQADFYVRMQLAPSRYTSLVLLGLCLPFMVLLRLFFPGGRLNLAEAGVFSLYVLGHVALLDAVANVLLTGRGMAVEIAASVVLLILVALQAGWTFWGTFWGTFRVFFALLVAYLGFVIGYGAAAVGLAFLVG